MSERAASIRPAAAMSGQRAAMQQDIRWLAARRDQFVAVPCPACDSAAASQLYDKYHMTHVVCGQCQTQYVTPRPTAELLRQFYAQSANYDYWAEHVFPASQEARRKTLFQPRVDIVASLLAEGAVQGHSLVEVGAGYGLFCEAVREQELFSHVTAVEPTPSLAEVCRQRGLETLNASYEDVRLDRPADVIAAFEVIEHLFAPAHFLRWCYDALRPGGWIFLTCPNILGFETLTLGQKSDTVDHEHLNLFNQHSIALLAERLGFTHIEVRTPGQLDIDIVRTAAQDGTIAPADLPPFLTQLLAAKEQTLAAFQNFLAEAGLSSHMRLLARRPADKVAGP